MGENKEKNSFFENFDWYRDYSFHQKTKFNDVFKKEIYKID